MQGLQRELMSSAIFLIRNLIRNHQRKRPNRFFQTGKLFLVGFAVMLAQTVKNDFAVGIKKDCFVFLSNLFYLLKTFGCSGKLGCVIVFFVQRKLLLELLSVFDDKDSCCAFSVFECGIGIQFDHFGPLLNLLLNIL